MTEAVAGGMATQYGQAAPIPVLAKASRAWLCGLFDLEILTNHKSSLIRLNFVQKVSKSARKNNKIGFAHLCNN
jgi:hypothetical protein